MSEQLPTVAVLGTGLMGAGVARNLAANGFQVTAWNRTPEKAEPLLDDGVDVATSAAAAIGDADIVLIWLFNGDAVIEVLEQSKDAWNPDKILVQQATIGVEDTARVEEMANELGIAMIDAPVLGTKKPAAEGKLRILASGRPELIERAKPVFDVVGARTVVAGDQIGDAAKLKLACNAWNATLTIGTAQSLAMLKGWGMDPQLFVDSVAETNSDSPYVHMKSALMMAGDYPASFMIEGLLKDMTLAVGDSENVDKALLQAYVDRLQAAKDKGLGQDDIAAVFETF